jgi:hypothetical protein
MRAHAAFCSILVQHLYSLFIAKIKKEENKLHTYSHTAFFKQYKKNEENEKNS